MAWAYILPLFAGLVVSIASMFVKRATEEGAGITRILFVSIWMFFIVLLPVLFLDSEVLDWSRWWGPVLAGTSTFTGGVLILASIRFGDVSVQAPLMGTKVIFVATYSLFFINTPIPASWWVGVFLTFFAILMLGISDLFRKKVSLLGVFLALASSALYALTDVLVAQEAPLFGRWPFIFGTVATGAVMSLGLIPFFRKTLWSISGKTWKWCLLAGALLVTQHLALLFALSYYGQATVINIMYSSRGIWGIALVWFVGHWFGSKEREVGGRIMFRRLIGALLFCLAIVIVLTDN